jgi:hypothetical protein
MGAFKLKDAAHLKQGFGQLPQLPVGDGTFVPVPYGSIENLARHLAQEWGDEEAYVKLLVTTDYCGSGACSTPDLDERTKTLKEFLASLPEEERKRISTSLVEEPQQERPDDPKAGNC